MWFKGFDFCVRTGGKKRMTRVYVLLLGGSQGQNRLPRNALWQLFWKPGHVFLALQNLCADTFPPGDPLRLLGEGSPSTVRRGKPFWIAPVMILEFAGPQTSAWQLYSNIKQRCPGVRLAAGKVHAVELRWWRREAWESSKGKSEHQRNVLITSCWRGQRNDSIRFRFLNLSSFNSPMPSETRDTVQPSSFFCRVGGGKTRGLTADHLLWVEFRYVLLLWSFMNCKSCQIKNIFLFFFFPFI